MTLPAVEHEHRSRRVGFHRWKATRPTAGNWFAVGYDENERDFIEETEILKDRIRQLLKRYGILFKELLAKELPLLQYSKLFRTLRLMELSGEIYIGRFFKQITGYQFISEDALEMIGRPLNQDAVFWLNAADPISLCGIKPDLFKALPTRSFSTYLVYHGSRLVLVVRKNGKVLDFRIPPDSPDLNRYFSIFNHLLFRKFRPLKSIRIETINRVSAFKSDYVPALKSFGFAEDYKGLELRRIR